MKFTSKCVAVGALAIGVASFASGTSDAAGLSQKEYNDLASSLDYDIHTVNAQSSTAQETPYKGLSQDEYQNLATQYS
ncbi:hypothetical protein [Staphylococcus agnetis]|uniref:hypothetical protein n=1 Tax=Staphylococcus agnetis TaxID=985762 RepID=UPI0004E401B3|nr:hypothetical protein [Staphylococcus agnetis]KFE42126.1 hypothetical protein SAGN_04850 [Staphylococcus agnetis]NJH65742.1 hypothetical protein [Staphylococcus agnetis]NJH97614.1 hypothetical protein [Staphylococcus agnetis]PTH47647.1 hypothetical protein BU587_06030 [Staphylococcus agnetis]PTH74494.1 hypothetical protein BU581_00520 [Staphylococcus agnetis]